ncbi:MAG: hypothetical protein U0744_17690 [Gemmataceae bacterium]
MDKEMILAAVGIGITLVLLVILSLLQTKRGKKEKADQLLAVQQANLGLDDAAPGSLPYFIACYRGSSARYFRVYSEPAGLLFLYAGPYLVMIDPETPRGADRRHWMLRSLKMLAITLASGAVGALMIVAVIARGISRNVHRNPAAAADVMFGVFLLIALAAIAIVIIVPSVLWRMTKRGAELDAASLSRLRELAETEEWSFRATQANVTDASMTLLNSDQQQFGKDEVGANLKFRHDPSGKWNIETLVSHDTEAALEAMAQQLPQMTIEPEIPERLAKTARLRSLGSRRKSNATRQEGA